MASATVPESFRLVRRFDFILIAVVLAVCIGGVFAIHSATHTYLSGADYARRQAFGIAIGIVAMLSLAFTDYAPFASRAAMPIYLLNLFFLAIAVAAGHASHGAQRWISAGPIEFQPSEFAKFTIIICLGTFLNRRRETIRDWRTIASAAGYVALPVLLILKQPDLGTALVLVTIWLFMLFVAGARRRHLLFIAAVAIGLFAVAWQTPLVKDYQKQRLASFIEPNSDPRDTGYHLHQSEIAIGSGGLTGEGYQRGSQTNGHFIPEQHTDFIFTIVGEETGFVGAAVLLGLYALMMLRCLAAIVRSGDMLGRLLVAGIVGMFAFHIIVNIGMTVGLMPVTGVPLPFFSYGLSSLLVSLASIGIVLSVAARGRRGMF